MAEKVFITDEIRARVTDLEYRNLPEEEFLKEIETYCYIRVVRSFRYTINC
ncbi:hypothetical protein HXA31_14060 [Salipaludibacillus agaradhaerens]|uniref:Uncharacterized protein n=1 Tax=Salipaludibacillus agaradhaerens TaxID=76935 RepID=A0A9Q4FXR5_SALAG|nr:hypothetical protein [Salipaludibacillus agaradhaerens]MCR6094953.1 hypothetical protein [Salipaludibacillus agaradhaerens]MCR6115489.1 hypothetical protein [Salipaludibacillus agaradhaerens]